MTTQARFALDTPLAELEAEAERIMLEAKATYRPVKTFALVSGGNDSATMLDVARPFIDAVVHIRTGIGIPETSEFVRDLCAMYEVPLLELVTPPEVYRDIVLAPTRKGFPGPAFHYITYHRLKARRLQDLQRDYATGKGNRILLISGVRENESERRMLSIGKREHEGPRGRLGKCTWANPIVHWTSYEMSTYRRAHNVPRSPVADNLHRSGECLCGAFARPDELDEIAFWYPETAAYIRSLEAEARAMGKPFATWGHRSGKVAKAPGPLCSDCVLPAHDESEATP